MKHIHVWIANKATAHVGQICGVCGIRPIVYLVKSTEVDL